MTKTIDVLLHTSRTGRYVTDEQDVIDMAAQGLLHDYGPQALAGGMHYFVMTTKGRERLAEYRASLPQPKPLTRAQRRYREFLHYDGPYEYSFGQFLRERYGKKTQQEAI